MSIRPSFQQSYLVTDLPPQLRNIVEQELEPDEVIQWYAQPRPSRLVWQTLPIVLFAIPWTAFAVFWMWGASGFGMARSTESPMDKVTLIFPLFGLPFVLIGLGMLSSPWWMLRKARRTLYVITKRRAVLFEGGWAGGMTVRSFEPDRLKDIVRKQRADGTGDIIIEKRYWRDNDGDRRSSDVGFYGIERVKEVEDMLQDLAAGQSNDAPVIQR